MIYREMSMKVLLIDGENGGSMKRCAEYLAGVGILTETLVLQDEIQGCVACGKCYKQSRCIFHDEINRLLDHADEYDGMIVSAKVYYGKPDDRVLRFLERLFRCDPAVWALKPAACVLSVRNSTSQTAAEQLAGSFGEMIYSGHCMVRTNSEDTEDAVQGMCDRMAWLLKCIDAGNKAGMKKPSGYVRKDISYMR